MGVGPVADAFVVASRIPNHFRAIFSEGAFNSAFLPTYARRAGTGGRCPGALLREPDQHPDADRSGRASGPRAFRHAGGGDAACPRLLGGSGEVRPGGNAHPHHLPLSPLRHPGDDPLGHSQRPRTVRRRGRGARPAQRLHRGGPGDSLPVPQCRLCGGLGRHGRGRSRTAARLGVGKEARRRAEDRGAAPRSGHDAFLQDPRAGGDRLGGRPACDVRRHDHRLLPAHRRGGLALLCRPDLSVAPRRHRHRGRHRPAAGDEPHASPRATWRARTVRRTGRWA